MAARYWVGGAGTWSSANTANWSATSGGAGGASVPTSADTPTFDANSGSGVVTFTNGGVTVGATTINNVNITLSLNAAFVTSGSLTLTTGTFTTNNYNVTATGISSSNSNIRTINLDSSTVTLSGSSPMDWSLGINLTFNAGTSQINCTGVSPIIVGAPGLYNVSLTNTAIATASFATQGTYNNLSIAGRTSSGISNISFSLDQTVNGTLTISAGANATMRTFLRSNTVGTTRTLTCAAVAPMADIDFRDIAIAGAAAPVSGTRLGDCKGNSGITFPAAKTVYWGFVSGSLWGIDPSNWSLTLGGPVDHAAFPLAQDTTVFPSGYPASGSTVTVSAAYNIGTIDMSARTSNTMTLTCTTTPTIYGNWINGTGVTVSGAGTLTFAGQGSQTITSAGKTFTQGFTVDSPGGSVTLQDAFTTNRSLSTAFSLLAGTFALGSYTATLSGAGSAFRCDNTARAKTLDSGNGTLVIAGTGGWSAQALNLTVTGTGTISLTSASAKTFNGGGVQTYPTLNQGGAGALTVTGSNKFANITNTYSATGATSVLFTSNTTNEFTAFNLTGTVGKVCTLGSTLTSQAFLKKSSIWYMGANSTNGAGNANLNFAAGGGIDYLSVSYINGIGPSTSKPGNFFAFF